MLAYAAHRRSRRRLSPSALALIIGGHAVAIALLAAARMDVVTILPKPPIDIFDVPLPPPPPTPPPPKPEVQPQTKLPPPPDSFVDRTPPVIPIPQPGPTFDLGPNVNDTAPDIGPALDTPIRADRSDPLPTPEPVRIAARATTPADLVRPPYPESKRRTEEEAVLRLRLGIDARGRVTSVDPVGTVDPAFLAAARSHLLRYWRYRPATEDGRPVATSMTVTLRFELEE
ncbi:energy transducer TonB [Sphingomonas sp. LHG3406-1]|uniref:energy transducer TonB n=1 Tax=Sphingomonas sp. LHG3406-1 TaxID=2804617 RepID=UPI002610D255|nr:energy transducer TonB [Sphingomonas sp. LHG3406-1]